MHPLNGNNSFATRLLRSGKLLWLAAVCALLACAGDARAESAKEDQLKAAFLYNFTRFVEWPRRADAEGTFVIGLWSDAKFADELRVVIGDRKVGQRAVEVRICTSAEELASAHLVFIAAQTSLELETTLAALHRGGILTVGESERFAAAGGMITFSRAGDKLRFAINLKTSEAAGLKLSAQLLKLATKVLR